LTERSGHLIQPSNQGCEGGKNLSFAHWLSYGDESGHVGFGTGKAPSATGDQEAVEAAKKSLIEYR